MPSDNKFPEIVYKYRNWKKDDEQHPHDKDVLLKNQLFFASPKDFNDPFDCKIPMDFSLLDTDEKIQAYLDKKEQDFKGRSSPKQMKELLTNFRKRLKTELLKVQEESNLLENDDFNNYLGILSLSERWCSILMWAHYADCHKGYCVGFWEEKLRGIPFVTGGRVNYPSDNKFPKISPLESTSLESFIQKSFTKSKEWLYEGEYRAVKLYFSENPPIVPETKDRIEIFPDDCISEIIIGLSASEQTKSEILQIAKDKGKPVYQCIKKPFKFELDKVRIL